MTRSSALRPALIAALALAATLGLAGCVTPSGGPTASGSPSGSASPTPTSRPTATTTATPIEGQCDTGKLTGRIDDNGGGTAGSTYVELILTNTGSAECSLQGWPGVSFVGDGNGTQLGAAADFDRSTPHPTVALAPGGTAKATLRIVDALNYPKADCEPKEADGFRVYPPGSTEALFVKQGGLTACTSTSVKLLTVSALVAG